MRKALKDYIDSPLRYNKNGDLMYNNMSIMNNFELPLINYIAESIVSKNDKVLNVGYGLGFFDKKVQDIGVSSHTIIECHPDVVKTIKLDNVELYSSIWQSIIPKLVEDKRVFDCIFFDTYMFNKECLKDEWFKFIELSKPLIADNGKICMFNWFKDKVDITNELKNRMSEFTLIEENFNLDNSMCNLTYKHMYWRRGR